MYICYVITGTALGSGGLYSAGSNYFIGTGSRVSLQSATVVVRFVVYLFQFVQVDLTLSQCYSGNIFGTDVVGTTGLVAAGITHVEIYDSLGSGITATIDSNCFVNGDYGILGPVGNTTVQITNNNFGNAIMKEFNR